MSVTELFEMLKITDITLLTIFIIKENDIKNTTMRWLVHGNMVLDWVWFFPNSNLFLSRNNTDLQ